jgi:hypothetical protein
MAQSAMIAFPRQAAERETRTMTKLDLLEIMNRGDKDFESLDEVEKNLYVTTLFLALYEMEGITHFFTHHIQHLPRLLTFLHATGAPNWRAVSDLADFLKQNSGGSWSEKALDYYLCSVSKEDNIKIDSWASEFYSKTQEMWVCVKAHVHQRYAVDFD